MDTREQQELEKFIDQQLKKLPAFVQARRRQLEHQRARLRGRVGQSLLGLAQQRARRMLLGLARGCGERPDARPVFLKLGVLRNRW